MKKLILMAAAAMLFAMPAAHAQKVNKEAILSKLEKSNAEINDPKKNAKAATWINRGKAYFEAAAEPTKSLFQNMEVPIMQLAVGNPEGAEQVTVNNVAYDVAIYPYFKIYIKGDKVIAWDQTQEIKEGLLKESLAAYAKAYEIDPGSAEKIKSGLKQISDFCSQIGNVSLDLAFYKRAADAYATAYEAQSNPAYGKADPELLYYAGYLETVNGANDPKSYALGADYLQKALDLGYEGENGVAYYYLFHCYYGMKDQNPENMQKAKQLLLTGIEKFPKSERILEGLMMLYTAEKGVGDPADLVTMIEAAIAREPENVDLWFGRGRIFAAMKNDDECIASFKRVTELAPQMYEGYFYTGYFYVTKGDVLNNELNDKPLTSQADFNEGLKTVNAVYMEALPWLEKALELKPNDPAAIEYLKSIAYRLRDEPGMDEKYNKYNEMYKQLSAQQ